MRSPFKTVKFWVVYSPKRKYVISIHPWKREALVHAKPDEAVFRVSGIYLPKKPRA